MKKRALICDDDEGITDVVRIVLEDKGYEVITLTSCKNVFGVIDEVQPHIVLLDLWMPDISGDAIAQHLKNHEKTKNIPIIIVSANRDAQKVADSVGADGCISKPFDIFDLETMVDKYAIATNET